MVPIVLLIYLFIHQSQGEIAFGNKEILGTQYLANIWPDFIKIAQSGHADAANIPGQPNYDAQFDTSDAVKAVAGAQDLPHKLESIKALIAAVADGSNLTLDPDLDSFYAMDAITVRLPGIVTATDALQQAEAEPAGAPGRLVHIAFAVDRLLMSSNDAVSSLRASIKNNASGETSRALSQLTDGLQNDAAALSQNGQALLEGRPAPDFAVACAKLLARTAAAWTAGNTELARLLTVRVDGFYRKLTVSLTVAGLFVVSAATLAAAIARGLSSRLFHLLGVMDKLVANDANVEIPYLSDRHETGRIAQSMAAFKQSVAERAKLKSEKALAIEQALVVGAVARGLDRLTQGDLTVHLSETFPPEFEKIRVDLNATVAKLNDVMRTISSSATMIHTGTHEISMATNDLSSRTQRQASTLEDSAIALNQVTELVKQSAAEATQASGSVSRTKAEAERSEAVVRHAVEAMAAIETSSKRISEIIGVMDEIAFQTNLLALNAAVEAARAGEAGRGFAVVASEVRALAQRSSEAAKQIRNLILASTKQVNHGAELVMETGKALERIASQVSEMNGAMTQIAASASGQAGKLDQINRAIGDMDKATQQNAEMAEETTAAARSLGDETRQLADLVGRFTMFDSHGAAEGHASGQLPGVAGRDALQIYAASGRA